MAVDVAAQPDQILIDRARHGVPDPGRSQQDSSGGATGPAQNHAPADGAISPIQHGHKDVGRDRGGAVTVHPE
ncbi:hypothetical protein GCM10023107_83890 [Actinoplanes octamycinicus]